MSADPLEGRERARQDSDTQMERCPECNSADRQEHGFVRTGSDEFDEAYKLCNNSWHSTPAAPETAPPSKPYYSVVVTFGIGEYMGEWTGREEKMEEQATIVCTSPSKEYAELVYKRLAGITSGTPRKEEA